MAKNINKDVVYRTAKSKEKDYMINDGGGLFLFVSKNGTKSWRYIYTFNKKQKKLAFGIYPNVTLDAARRKTEDASENIANSIDPNTLRIEKKKAQQLSLSNNDRVADGLPILNSFADLTRQWLASIAHLTSQTTQIKKTSRLERLAFPVLGDMPIKEIKSSDVLAAIKPLIHKMQLETAHRLHAEISSVFAYAIVHDCAEYDPSVRRQLTCPVGVNYLDRLNDM